MYTHAAILLIQEIWLVGRLDSKWEDIFSAVKYDLHSKLIKSGQKKTCTPHHLPVEVKAGRNKWINQSILQLRTQIEYESKLNLRFDGGYGFTAFAVDISTLNEITNQSIPHEGRQMCGLRVESDIRRLSWVSLLFKQELVPVVKSTESVGVGF